MLLIVTNRDDFAADYMITRLEEKGICYFRLDSEDAINLKYSVHCNPSGIDSLLRSECKEVLLADVDAVWYRRAIHPVGLDDVPAEFRRFAGQELRYLLEGLLPESGNIKWVNPLGATERAERKVRQLALAPLYNLPIPPTIVSNNPSELLAFAKRHGRIICKPISQGLVATRSQWFAVRTWEVMPDNLAEVASCGFPTLLQKLVPKGLDIRLTIIGDRAFPVAIETLPDADIDWRSCPNDLVYRPCTLPEMVIDNCKKLLASLGLVYGAFDFVKSPEGELFFLEVNPAGEWAWLELELDLPLRDAFIDLFQL
jgi:glutathione synthase/RimK-type ligase-like ATP-grasp enzyme